MVYACMSDRVFVTKKELPTTGVLPPEARAIWEFCETHDFAIDRDPVTGEMSLIAVEKVDGRKNES